MAKYLLGELVLHLVNIPLFLTKVVAVFFCGIELLSMNENVRVVTGNDFFKMFKKMLFRVKAVKKELTELGEDDDKCDEPKYD